MTFTSFDSFVEWCKETEGITVLETNFPEDKNKWVDIEDINDMEPAVLMDLMLSAYDSDFGFGSWHHEKYNGVLTIYEN